MPIGSCYRAIDFSISNMTNSGISKVAVITQYNSHSLHNHLSSEKLWQLRSKNGGLFIFSPYFSDGKVNWFEGDAHSIFQNISYLKKSIEPYVVISYGNCIYKMDYNNLLQSHIKNDADISVVYTKPNQHNSNCPKLTLDKNNMLLDVEEDYFGANNSCISAGVYIISRTLLIKLVSKLAEENKYDIVKNILIEQKEKLKIHCYEFEGYFKHINSTNDYYRINMDFLNLNTLNLFTREEPLIYTKLQDLAPAKYNETSLVTNSLVGSGCIINGEVKNSILFRKIFTNKNSVINNSIIMENSYIGNNCIIENAILDKEVIISDGKNLIGAKDNYVIVSKGTVV